MGFKTDLHLSIPSLSSFVVMLIPLQRLIQAASVLVRPPKLTDIVGLTLAPIRAHMT